MTEEAHEYRVLCVDDEPRVLDGMRRTLGMNFDVQTAAGGALALAMLDGPVRFAVTISDMRMPGMDGATYLELAAEKDPDMVRMLLTGQSDMPAAIRAINQGRIFRFLTKPCDTDLLHGAVEDALEQHRLISSEKELLQKTLYGCIDVLTDMLSLVNPLAFARAGRVKGLVQDVGRSLDLREPWQLELAVMLSHLGYVGIAPEVLARAYSGKTVSDSDRQMLDAAPRTAHKLMAHIPRIGAVLSLVECLGAPPPALDGLLPRSREGRLPWGVHVILAAQRADELSHLHPMPSTIAEVLGKEKYHPAVVDALARAEFQQLALRRVISVSARELEPGMYLLEDALSDAGVVMARGGQAVTRTVSVLLKRMALRDNLREPLSVSVLGSDARP